MVEPKELNDRFGGRGERNGEDKRNEEIPDDSRFLDSVTR